MFKSIRNRAIHRTACLLMVCGLSACDRSTTVEVSLHGVNYSDEVFSYYVKDPLAKDKSGAGGELIDPFGAGGTMCCATLPKIWRPGMRVTGKAPLQKSPSFLRASTFDQNDLYGAACEFEEEVKAFITWLRERGTEFRPSVQRAGFGNSHASEWEEIATWWGHATEVSPAVLEFFDNYVHDSRAWFKILPGYPDNEKDVLAMLESWVRRRKDAATRNAMRSQMHGRGNSMYQTRAGDGLTEEQRRATDEYEKTRKIPRLITEGREPWGSASDMIRCAGYLRFRKIYGGSDSELLS